MRSLIFFLFCVITTSSYAFTDCPLAAATTDINFCPSFAIAARCRCVARGFPDGVCQDVNTIYKRMIALFGSIERACQYQKDTDPQTCMDDWSCYRNGGSDSKGGLCSATGKACQV